jgi:HAD superfamily hydrolase (TIGR01549 family)
MHWSETLVVLDMDGVLLDLRVDVESVRARIKDDFSKAGIKRSFKPLLASIDDALEEVERKDREEAGRLRKAAWSHIDGAEHKAAESPRARSGVNNFLKRLKGLPLALYTNNNERAAIAALNAAGIGPEIFRDIFGRKGSGSLKPSGRPIVEALRGEGPDKIRRVFMVGDHSYDMMAAGDARKLLGRTSEGSREIIAIGMRKDRKRNAELESAGADFLAATLDEAADLILARPTAESLSIVLLAYNEEGSIAKSIEDARRFCTLYAPDYEILVVDDGSTDGTPVEMEKAHRGDVRLIKHPTNLGMGAAMRDGYMAAKKSYVVHLPGDRQVRAQSLAPFLAHLAPSQVPLSHYEQPPSGPIREVMSAAFRMLLSTVGGLSVDFAGTYIFNRALFDRVDLPDSVASKTFFYSFQLLEQMKRAGCSFKEVIIHPFPREAGQSRVVTGRRIAKVAFEVLRQRAASTLHRHWH